MKKIKKLFDTRSFTARICTSRTRCMATGSIHLKDHEFNVVFGHCILQGCKDLICVKYSYESDDNGKVTETIEILYDPKNIAMEYISE